MTARWPLVLASGSARRASMLREAGFSPVLEPADIDDATVNLTTSDPRELTLALALFKVRRVENARRARGAEPAVILGADTMCVLDGAMIGKPSDEAHAASMLRAFEGVPHEVVTAWCIAAPDGTRVLDADCTTVHLGRLTNVQRDLHLASGAWRGKAGGYNYPEALAAGWPLRCEGLWETVVGLPLARFSSRLAEAMDRGSFARTLAEGNVS